MKTSARFLAMLLAVVMIASAALSVSAFSDVTAGVEHATAISVLNQLGVIGGYEDGTFKPDQAVTRAEMAKLVYVLYTTFTDAGSGSVKFNDVKADNWAVGYISWCASKGIIGGYGDGNFGPSDNVTYDQALKMVAGALGYNEWDSAQWPVDVRMKTLNELKLGEDMPATVMGSDKLTRAQVAQIMYNALFAPMKETKTINQKLPGTDFYLPVEQNKVLALDVWNFVEETYAIVGTENNGAKTSDEDKIAIQKVVDGEKTGSAETVELADLGLEAYSAKTDDLINLEITTITKNDEMLASASVNGSVTDKVSVSYDKTYKFVKVNGVEYTAKDFEADAEYPVAFYNDKGVKLDKTIFDEDDKLTEEFRSSIAPNKAVTARVVDFDGNGKVDAIVLVDKIAYEVTSITTKSSVKYVNYKALDGSVSGSTPIANATETLAKGDIFVGAKIGNTLYVEIVKPVETYATKLSTTSGKVTLNEVGEVAYKKLTVTGAVAKDLDTSILGKDNPQVYYIYNGEVIFTDAAGALTDYNFAILQNVEKKDGEFNDATMEETTAYIATILVEKDGALVEEELTLSDESTVAGVKKTAEELYNEFKAGKNSDGKREYKYTLIAAYEEDEKGWALTINANLDEDTYAIVPAGSTIKFNADTGFYTVGTYGKVVADDTTAIYYRYAKTNTASGSFMFIDKYAKVTDKSFEIQTWGESYLAYNETTRKYTLLATIVVDEIKGITEEAASYVTDGRLVLYAPESSSVQLQEGKNYNSYIFMDNATLTNKEPALDTNKEYDKVLNKGTTAGYLYGYNPSTEIYDEITKDDDLDTVEAAYISDVLVNGDKNLIYTNGDDNDPIGVADDVVIWGLADADDNGVYTQLTFADLQEMFELVADYNKTKTEELEEGQTWTDLVIDAIILSYKDTNDEFVVSSIIVEIYEADEEGDVYSVNDLIFDNYNK